MQIVDSNRSPDHLRLAQDQKTMAILDTFSPASESAAGPSHAAKAKEELVFSDVLTKVNRKQKSQDRILLITDKAVYNIVPNKDHKFVGFDLWLYLTVSSDPRAARDAFLSRG